MVAMRRLPLHSGSRIPVVAVPDDALVLTAPSPLDPLANVGAAVAEALRYPLAGSALERLAPRGGRATIVVQPPALPLPSPDDDPRRDALAAVFDALQQSGVPLERQTLLVAGGLARRAGRRELEQLLRPDRARGFRGRVAVHDCEDDGLRPIRVDDRVHRIHPALVETDLVVTLGAGETVLHGGATAFVDACAAGTCRSAEAVSLLEPSVATGWRLAADLEAAIARATPVIGVSLVLDRPHATGLYRGYPWAEDARRALARSPFRRLLNLSPAVLRRRLLAGIGREVCVVAALAGPPSVAHAEALVRGAAIRGATVPRQLDTIVVPLPWEGLQLPREPLNPITAAALGLGHVLRLWREQPPLAPGGTVILLHPFSRVMGHGPQAPYRTLFSALRDGTGRRLRSIEAAAARDRRALAAYRNGTAPHPRLPFADWESCRDVLVRAERVIVAGCRDAGAARALGLVPSHNAATALEMAQGLAGDGGMTGVVVGPPYPALTVSGVERQVSD
jgi:Lactate racemase N-terminal domain